MASRRRSAIVAVITGVLLVGGLIAPTSALAQDHRMAVASESPCEITIDAGGVAETIFWAVVSAIADFAVPVDLLPRILACANYLHIFEGADPHKSFEGYQCVDAKGRVIGIIQNKQCVREDSSQPKLDGNGKGHPDGNGKGHPDGNGKGHPDGNGKGHPDGNGKGHPDGNGKGHPDGNGKDTPCPNGMVGPGPSEDGSRSGCYVPGGDNPGRHPEKDGKGSGHPDGNGSSTTCWDPSRMTCAS